ncbi:MAG: DUF4190 domain-containing protein [Phycisphaerales bacterium]|jgi:hypothetical protein|nr:DUF4190 domain-containing protein [Planctomycetota bacterium]
MQPHRGALVLVLGILGIVFGCAPVAVVAWVMGRSDLAKIDAGVMDPAGRGTTQAGMILGIVGTVLFLLSAVIVLLALSIFGVAAFSLESSLAN